MIEMDFARLQYQSITPKRFAASAAKARDIPRAGDTSGTPRDEKLYQACQDFEAIFIKQMLKSMKNTVNKTGLVEGGFAEEIYDDMLYDEYASKMAKTAGFGITESLYKQLSATVYK